METIETYSGSIEKGGLDRVFSNDGDARRIDDTFTRRVGRCEEVKG